MQATACPEVAEGAHAVGKKWNVNKHLGAKKKLCHRLRKDGTSSTDTLGIMTLTSRRPQMMENQAALVFATISYFPSHVFSTTTGEIIRPL